MMERQTFYCFDPEGTGRDVCGRCKQMRKAHEPLHGWCPVVNQVSVRRSVVKVVYIAGPFRGANSWVIESNIRRAEALALQVWELGAAAICPHANTRFYQGVLPDERWLSGDLAILERCDVILMTRDWLVSSGARGEHDYAKALGIPVFYSLEALSAYIQNGCNTGQ